MATKLVIYLKNQTKPIVLSNIPDEAKVLVNKLVNFMSNKQQSIIEIYNNKDCFIINGQDEIQAFHMQTSSELILDKTTLNDDEGLNILQDLDITTDEPSIQKITETKISAEPKNIEVNKNITKTIEEIDLDGDDSLEEFNKFESLLEKE